MMSGFVRFLTYSGSYFGEVEFGFDLGEDFAMLAGHFEEDVEFVQELDEVFADGGAEGVCPAVFVGAVCCR